MSKTTRTSLDTYFNGPSADYNANYSIWSNKAEWKLAGQVRARLNQMHNARQSSCYLINYDGTKSWDSHWDLLEKDYLMYSEFSSTDDWESNIKSSIAYRTVAAIDARERKQEIKFIIEARNETDEDKGLAVTHRYLFEDYFRRNPEIRYSFLEASKSAKIFGTSVAYIPYTVRIREVEDPKTPDIDKESIAKGELPAMEYETKTIVDYEDVDFVPWDIRDFYIDPNASDIHGTSGAATDVAAIQYLTASQVKLMFQGDPDVKNLDKVDGLQSNSQNYATPFFRTGRLDSEKGYGELVMYYNVETDSEIILYEDVVLKDGPIPYKDKKIPFVAFHFVRHPGHFYGMGVGDVTIQQSSEESALKNARLERIKFSTNPPTFIGATIFGEVDDQWDRMEPNMIIKVGDVSQVRPLELPTVPFDSFRMSEELKDEAVMNTGVNPQGLSLPMASTPATNTLAMKENMGDMVNMYQDNMMRGMAWWGELLDSRFCQFYWLPTKKASLELGKKQMRELRLEDIDLYTDEGGNYQVRSIKGSKIIELSKDMFEWNNQPSVYIHPDFVSPISTAFRMRKAQEIFPQLMPLAGEPGMPMQNGQPAVVDVRKLTKWYLKEVGMSDEDIALDEDEDRIEEIKQAAEQQQAMQDGEDIPGRPGEPKAHKYAHAIELMRLNDTMAAPEFMDMMLSQDPQLMQFVQAMDTYRRALADHLRVDSLLDMAAGDSALAESDAVSQQMDMAMNPVAAPPMPRNNAVNIPTVSGNQGLPNQGGIPVPNKMATEDITGQMLQP